MFKTIDEEFAYYTDMEMFLTSSCGQKLTSFLEKLVDDDEASLVAKTIKINTEEEYQNFQKEFLQKKLAIQAIKKVKDEYLCLEAHQKRLKTLKAKLTAQ